MVWHASETTRRERATGGVTVWLTGLSGSGKSSVAAELERRLVAAGRPAYLLDGDNLRHGLSSDLGFSAADRIDNVRRTGEAARLMATRARAGGSPTSPAATRPRRQRAHRSCCCGVRTTAPRPRWPPWCSSWCRRPPDRGRGSRAPGVFSGPVWNVHRLVI